MIALWTGDRTRRRITVTRQDIMEGKREDCRYCPVTRAVSRHIGPSWVVLTYKDCVIFTSVDRDIHADLSVALPMSVRKWIADFDMIGREAVKPMWFELGLPTPCVSVQHGVGAL